jgi:hypothetical protein
MMETKIGHGTWDKLAETTFNMYFKSLFDARYEECLRSWEHSVDARLWLNSIFQVGELGPGQGESLGLMMIRIH